RHTMQTHHSGLPTRTIAPPEKIPAPAVDVHPSTSSAIYMGSARQNSFTHHQMTRTAPIRTTRLGTATITYSARSAMKTLAMRVQRRIQGAISSFVLRDDITRNATTTPASLTVAETVMRLTPNPRIFAL